jgi:hypothetical protein
MRIIVFFILILISKLVFAQDEDKRGTIKLKKPSDSCVAMVLGYSGENFVDKEKIANIKKVELNEGCDYKIISFSVMYTDSEDWTRIIPSVGDKVGHNVGDQIKGASGVTFGNIIAKSNTTGEEIKLPPIILIITD